MGNTSSVELNRQNVVKSCLKWEDSYSYRAEEGDEYITASEDEDSSGFFESKVFSMLDFLPRVQGRKQSERLESSINHWKKNLRSGDSYLSINGRIKYKSSKEEYRKNRRNRSTEIEKEKSLHSMGIKERLFVDWRRGNLTEKRDVLAILHYRLCNTINPDLKIFIKNTEFNCHKILLQCYSDYFDELFSKGDCSSIDFNVEFKEVSKSAFVAIYSWMLAVDELGFSLLHHHNILETLLACQALKVREMEIQIISFLESNKLFSEETAYFQYQHAKKLGLEPIMNMMLPRIKGFFMSLVASKEFLELPIQDVIRFLSSDAIIVHSEMEVFLSAIRWLRANPEERSHSIVKLMSCIRFGHMKPLEIVDIRNNPEFSHFTFNMDIQRFIDDGLALAVKKTLCQGGGDWVDVGIPQPRDWHRNTKSYRSYNEFMQFIKEVRGNPKIMYSPNLDNFGDGDNENHDENLDETVVPQETHISFVKGQNVLPPNRENKIFDKSREQSHGQVIAELMARQKNGNTFLSSSSKQLHSKLTDEELKKAPLRRPSLQVMAATIIQAHWRGYTVRKSYNQNMHLKIPPHLLKSARPPSPLSVMLTPPKTVTIPNLVCISKQQCSVSTDNDSFLHEACNSNTSPSSTSESNADQGLDQQSPNESVFIFGGLDPNSLVGPNNTAVNVYKYNSSENSWDVISKMPSPRYYHGAAVLKGRIYIAGGADPRKEETAAIASVSADVWSFDPVLTTWRVEPRLKTARKNCGLVAAHGALYVIGGQDKHDKVLNTVEKLELHCGCWVEVSPLSEGRAGLAVAKHNHMIWVAGGVTAVGKQVITKTVECFDPKRNVWIPKTPLRAGRAFGAMISLKGSLFIVGGAIREGGSAASTPSIDVWDEREKMWLLKTEMTVPRHGHTVSRIGNKLLVIGGSTTIYMKCLASVEAWCTNKCTWLRGICSVPGVITGHASVTLPLARSRAHSDKIQQ